MTNPLSILKSDTGYCYISCQPLCTMGVTCSMTSSRLLQQNLGRRSQVSCSHPLVPPPILKKDLIPYPELVFKAVDSHACNAPSHVSNSVEDLAGYLTRSCHSDVQKARAVFVWVACNIEYDVYDVKRSHRQPQDAATVLRRRLAVCAGYSKLCKALCDSAGLPCLVVSGFSKGSGHEPGTAFTLNSKTDHAWNLVHVNNQWRPLECTWGAGHVGDDPTFKGRFEDFWFLTDPDQFLLQHFPYINSDLVSSAAYQLVKKPIDLKEFSALAEPTVYALMHAVRLLSHPLVHIKVTRPVTVRLKAGTNPLISAKGYLLDPSSRAEDRSCVMTTVQPDGTCDILVRPGRDGSFLLKIFGRVRIDVDDTLKLLATYAIMCHKSPPNFQPYPDNSGHYGYHFPEAEECGLQTVKVMTFSFKAKKGEVKVPVPLSRFTSLRTRLEHAEKPNEDLNSFTFIDHIQEAAVVHARLQRAGYYRLRLFAARHQTDENLLHVADFLLHAVQDNTHLPPFPKWYKFQHSFHARLLQPLSGRVPRDAATYFLVYAPDMAAINVGDTELRQKDGVWEGQVTPERNLTCLTMRGAPTSDPEVLWQMFDFEVVNSTSTE